MWTGTVVTEQYWPDTTFRTLGLGHQPNSASYRMQISRSLDGTAISGPIFYTDPAYVPPVPSVTITASARVLSKGSYTLTIYCTLSNANYAFGDSLIIQSDTGAGFPLPLFTETSCGAAFYSATSAVISSQPNVVSYRVLFIKAFSTIAISNIISFP